MNNQQRMPEGWKNNKLGSIVEFRNGKGHEKCISENGKYIVVNSKFISSNQVVSKYTDQQICPLSKGEVVMVMSDVPKGKAIAKCFLVDKDDKYTLNQRIGSFKSDEIISEFLYFLLNRNRFFLSFDDGVNQTNLRKEDILSCPMIYPSISEQKRIVQILETWEQYVGILNQKLRIKKRLRHSLLQKLVADNYYKNAIKVKIKDICDISRGGSPRPIEQFITKDPNGYNWLRIGDIENDAMFIQSTSEKIIPEGLKKTTLVNPGDFILSNSMSFGRPYIMKISACIHDGWLALRNINKKVDKFFLFYLLTSDKMQNTFKSLAAGSGVRNLKKEIVSEISINLPDLEEQEHITKILLSLDEEINLLKKQKSLVVKQKNYLLNNLITGQIRVPEFASHN